MKKNIESRTEAPEMDSSLSVSNNGSSRPNIQNRRLQLQHLSAATGLILTYLIEIGVQIFLTIHCCRSLIIPTLNWDWSTFITMSFILSSLVVSCVSLCWVCRSLDFAGRLCGRLLCYVMHFFLLGLPWRYLKLAFAYDSADVQEFVTLRIFQAYIQSLPLASIHLAWLFTFSENLSTFTIWMVVVESISIVTSLVIATYITPPKKYNKHISNTKSSTTLRFYKKLKCFPRESENEENIMWFRVLKIELNLLSRGLLIVSRLVVVAILLLQINSWIILAFLLHILISTLWIRFSENRRYKNQTKTVILNEEISKVTLRRIIELLYVTFWDISSTFCATISLKTWILIAILWFCENLTVLIFYYFQRENVISIVSVTSIIGLIVGSILFIFLNLTSLSYFRTLFGKRISHGRNRTSPSITNSTISSNMEEERKSASGTPKMNSTNIKSSSWESITEKNLRKDETKYNPIIQPNNYSSISQVVMTKKEIKRPNSSNSTKLKDPHQNRMHNFSPRDCSSSPSGGQYDICCNDSNGSSNSRNTNTLVENEAVEVQKEERSENTHFVFCYPGTTTTTHYHPSIPKGNDCIPIQTVRTSTPVEIKRASRVIMNIPKHYEKKSRCPCHRNPDPPIQNLGSYGILFCEGDSGVNSFGNSRNRNSNTSKLRVLCAKCFQNHDPLLTDCALEEYHRTSPQIPSIITVIQSPRLQPLPSETTDYPSETELTYDEEIESESVYSTATYTTWPHPSMWTTLTNLQPNSQSETMPKEFTSKEYVRTWLLNTYAREQRLTLKNRRKRNSHYASLPYPIGRRHAPIGRSNLNICDTSESKHLSFGSLPPPSKQHPKFVFQSVNCVPSFKLQQDVFYKDLEINV